MQKIHLLPSSQVCDTLAEKKTSFSWKERIFFIWRKWEEGISSGVAFLVWVMHLRFLVFCIWFPIHFPFLSDAQNYVLKIRLNSFEISNPLGPKITKWLHFIHLNVSEPIDNFLWPFFLGRDYWEHLRMEENPFWMKKNGIFALKLGFSKCSFGQRQQLLLGIQRAMLTIKVLYTLGLFLSLQAVNYRITKVRSR